MLTYAVALAGLDGGCVVHQQHGASLLNGYPLGALDALAIWQAVTAAQVCARAALGCCFSKKILSEGVLVLHQPPGT